MTYRSEEAALIERAEGERAAIADIDRERGARARELAALEQRLGVAPRRSHRHAAWLALAVLGVLAGALQTARVEVVTPSGRPAFLFVGGYGTQRLTVNLD